MLSKLINSFELCVFSHHISLKGTEPRTRSTTMFASSFSRVVAAFAALAAAASTVGAVDCTCPPSPIYGPPPIPLGFSGNPAIQCAYPGGACTWSSVSLQGVLLESVNMLTFLQTGELLNGDQTNCQTSIASGSTSCPVDLNGDAATLIHHLYPFSCIYVLFINAPDFPSIKCDWDEVCLLDLILQRVLRCSMCLP